MHTTLCRSSVMTVSGTGLNTRRSPSVMRLVSIVWRCPATAETPEMRWRRHNRQIGTPTGWCSALKTATTTVGQEATVPVTVQAGGSTSVRRLLSTLTAMLHGRLVILSLTSKPVGCWWNSTKQQSAFCWLFVNDNIMHCVGQTIAKTKMWQTLRHEFLIADSDTVFIYWYQKAQEIFIFYENLWMN